MTENQAQGQYSKDQKSCQVCGQAFNSDRELQDHQKTAHQNKPSDKQPTSERNQPGRNQDDDIQKQGNREKIA